MAKYVARLNGQIVGTRTSKSRTYTHAVVVLYSREHQRTKAYEYQATETDRSNFNYLVRIAEGRSPYPQTQEQLIKASMLIDGGFDAFVERIRQERIANFERMTFEPKVVTWAGRRDLAQKALGQYQKPWNDFAVVVEAVEVVKPAKKTKAQKAADEALDNFNYVGSRHHY